TIGIVIMFISCSHKKGIDVCYYLPANYNKNYIVVFFDQENGLPKERADGKKIFRIPESGILYTQEEQQIDRWFSEEYFFVNESNQLTKISPYSHIKSQTG